MSSLFTLLNGSLNELVEEEADVEGEIKKSEDSLTVEC